MGQLGRFLLGNGPSVHPMLEVEQSRRELMDIKKGCHSVSEYIQAFLTPMYKGHEMTQEEAFLLLMRGLESRIRE